MHILAESRLIQHRILEEFTCAVVDPLYHPASHRPLLEGVPTKSLAPTMLKSQQHALPVLVDLSALDATQRYSMQIALEQAEANQQPTGFCALLAGDAPVDKILSHLKIKMIRSGVGGQRHLFRFYDPRVWHQLQWMLDKKTKIDLMGPINSWMYPLEADWHVTTQPEQVGVGAEDGEITARRAKQSMLITRIGLINRVIDKLINQHGYDVQKAYSMGEVINQAIETGQSTYPLTAMANITGYATDYIVYGPDFHAHPEVIQALNTLHDPNISYREAIDDIESHTIQTIMQQHLKGNKNDLSIL